VSITEAAERRITIVGRYPVPLARIWSGDELPCWVFDKCVEVSQYLLNNAPAWLDG
jgi:hypothetical protein